MDAYPVPWIHTSAHTCFIEGWNILPGMLACGWLYTTLAGISLALQAVTSTMEKVLHCPTPLLKACDGGLPALTILSFPASY